MATQQSLQQLQIASASGGYSLQAGMPTARQTVALHNPSQFATQVEVWVAPVDVKSEAILQWVRLENTQGIFHVEPYSTCEIDLQVTVPLQAVPGLYSYEIRAQSSAHLGHYLRCYQQLTVEPPAQAHQDPIFHVEPATNSLTPFQLEPEKNASFSIQVTNRSHHADCFYLTCLDIAPGWFDVVYPLAGRAVGLPLAPGESGNIVLNLHPPQQTVAGNYTITLRLGSQHQPDTILFEAIYLTLAANPQLAAKLYPETALLPTLDQTLTLELQNSGNVSQAIAVTTRAPQQRFTYDIEPAALTIAPGDTQTVTITPVLRQRWLGLQNFKVPLTLEIRHQHQPETVPLTTCEATLKWQSQHRWLLKLILAGCLSSGFIGAALLAWWHLLYQPTVKPQILNFATTGEQYRAGEAPDISFDWQISNRDEVQSMRLVYAGNDGKDYELYNASLSDYGLPAALQARCETVITHSDDSWKATLIGAYRDLRRQSPHQKSLHCGGFGHPELNLTEGKHTFRLDVYNQAEVAVPAATKLIDVEVAAPSPPKIVNLSATAVEYRVAEAEASKALNVAPVQLNWELSNAADIQSLKLVGLNEQGVTNVAPTLYHFDRGVPGELTSYCQVIENHLRCNGVPTQAMEPGQYEFYLTVFPRRNYDGEEIMAHTSLLSIRPPAPEIVYFKVNGQDVRQTPKLVHVLEHNQTPTNLKLTWQVTDGAKVELLPAPGHLEQATGELSYPLSPAEGTETLTLKVTHPETGEETSQSLVIEKVKAAQVLQPSHQTRPISPLNLQIRDVPFRSLPVPVPPPPPR
ncbi:COG1470 family protein [Leptothoe spongobia]|uniref:Uncharacterized protein n=1 Tax=Leptothoe spongobia TAU-MAC 1115 TaxID=1967444 RepID=A0A947DIK8_9CYAN|nr:hypothetical protein [Leptothoe spongobia]MBT9316641.1 hypothetical protein [Leptothoe spongobia TAU-MAC 1115]